MSSYVLSKYNGVPPVFNSGDFDLVEIIADTIVANEITSGLITNTSSLTSNSVVSNAVSIQNNDGTSSNAITETELNQTISQITGGSLNNSLSTLLAIDQAINNDPNFYTDITASIATVQTNVNNNTSLITVLQNRATTDESNITNLQNTKLNVSNPNYTGTMYGSNLNLTGILTLSNNVNVSGLSVSPGQISYLANVSSDIQNQLNSKASTSSPTFSGTVNLPSTVDNGIFTANNNVVLGTNNSNTTTINSNIIVNNKTISPTTLSLIYDLSGSSLQSQLNSLNTNIGSLQTNTNGLTYSSGTTNLTNNLNCKSISDNGLFSCSGNATIGTNSSNSLIVNSTSSFLSTASFNQIDLSGNIISNGLSVSPSKIGYLSNVSSDIQNQITNNTNNITTNANNIATNTNNITNNTNSISSINSTLLTKQNTLTFDSSPTLNSTNIVNSGGIYSTLLNYETTSALTTTLSSYATNSSLSNYATTSSLSNYATTSSLSNYAPINNSSLTGITTVNEVSEQINSVSGITTSLSLSYTSCKGINYIQTPTSNFSLTLTNIPTTSTNASYTISLLIPSKYYCNSINVNGSSITIIAGNGVSNISINSSSTMVLQQLSILFLNSTTPTVITNVLSLF